MKTFTFLIMFIISNLAVASDQEVECLALNIYHEARGEGIEGWLAVAFVTVNRKYSGRFPDSICEVVYDSYQFSWTHDNIPDDPILEKYADRKAWEYIQWFAKGFFENYDNIVDPTEGSLYYHTHQVAPYWKNHFTEVATIGNHIFYTEVDND